MENTVILANGDFPKHAIPLEILEKADFIIACDGAADKLIAKGISPGLIIGDLDSISSQTKGDFNSITLRVSRQDNTDLMKAMDWCVNNGKKRISILGATGGREDHTIGNLFAFMNYATCLDVKLYTDTGCFTTLVSSGYLDTYIGQQVSLFPQPLTMKIRTEGLKYPLDNQALSYLFSGTLNEAETEKIYLEFDKGALLVYRLY